MASKIAAKAKVQKGKFKVSSVKSKTTAYRMSCPRTANGLSHFVMYGDIKEKETLL